MQKLQNDTEDYDATNDIKKEYDLNSIRDKIEIMPKFNQIEILRILYNHKQQSQKEVILNENKYGIHINLTELENDLIEKLNIYINYVNTQEINLNDMEKQQEDCLHIYFNKDNKDNATS